MPRRAKTLVHDSRFFAAFAPRPNVRAQCGGSIALADGAPFSFYWPDPREGIPRIRHFFYHA
jgi:hypothetical protein